MNMKILIPILIGIVVVIAISAVSFSVESKSSQLSEISYETDFTYSDVDKITEILATQNIPMSLPTEITDHTIGKYCTYFDEDDVQRIMKYCITTALLDSDGKPIGNINMGGSSNTSTMVLAIIEASPFLDSKEDEVYFIFETMIDTMVCDCWEEQQPGGFESVPQWLKTAEEHYLESPYTTLKSKIEGLDQKQLILEITPKDGKFLWTLIIIK
jgi:hypothetical protein